LGRSHVGRDRIPVAETGLLVHYLGQDAKNIPETRFLAAMFLVGFQPTLAISRGWDTPCGITAKLL